MSARQIKVEILQVLDQILQGLALRPVIRIFLQVAKPPVVFLPVNVLNLVHRTPRQTSRRTSPTRQVYCGGRVECQPRAYG